MDRRRFVQSCGIAATGSIAGCNDDQSEQSETPSTPTDTSERTTPRNESGFSPWIGKNGGMYLYAQPGELTVEIAGLSFSEDVTRIETILATPDRNVVDEATVDTIDGDGQRRETTATLSTQVERAGVYVLNVTAPENQYGSDVAWSFRTNCEQYLIETAGHHGTDEPIVLRDQSRPGTVWFRPPADSFDVEVSDLPSSVTELTLKDQAGSTIQTIQVEDGTASATVSPDAGDRLQAPWGLHLPTARGTIYVDGVTRNTAGTQSNFADLVLWSTASEPWFDFEPHRWVLLPYKKLLYGAPEETGEHTITVRNNGSVQRQYDLTLESETEWASLSQRSLQLGPGESTDVTIEYTHPEEIDTRRTADVVVTSDDTPEFTTYASVTVSTEREQAAEMSTPLEIKPYRHENAQFGYVSDYPHHREQYADLENQWSTVFENSIARLRDGEWTQETLSEAVVSEPDEFEGSAYSISSQGTEIAFDADNDMYVIGWVSGRTALLHSTDGGETFTAYDVGPDDVYLDMECYTGHNTSQRPPVLLRARELERGEDWRRVNELEIVPVEKRDGQLNIGEPIVLTDKALGLGSHSGMPNPVVSQDSVAHIIWAEATNPDGDAPGTPSYVVSYDRDSRELLGDPVLAGYSSIPNDTHNIPAITMDSDGYLHAVTGSHGDPFVYTRTETPHTAHEGWTEPVETGDGLKQTYVGLVCDSDDTLHLVYRLWRNDVEPHPNTHHAVLAYQRKPKGQSWQEPQILVVSPLAGYSIFYHRLTLGRDDRLMLSYDNWVTHRFYRRDRREAGFRRKTMTSTDGGETWQLLDTEDLVG